MAPLASPNRVDEMSDFFVYLFVLWISFTAIGYWQWFVFVPRLLCNRLGWPRMRRWWTRVLYITASAGSAWLAWLSWSDAVPYERVESQFLPLVLLFALTFPVNLVPLLICTSSYMVVAMLGSILYDLYPGVFLRG